MQDYLLDDLKRELSESKRRFEELRHKSAPAFDGVYHAQPDTTRQALEEYDRALRRLSSYVLDGIVPPDLEHRIIPIARCIYCSKETTLHINSRPVCAGCAAGFETAGQPL